MTCKEYYEKITTDSSYQNAIKNADLITVSIGSNELLGIAIEAVASVTGIDANDSNFEEKAKQVILNSSLLKQYSMLNQIYNFFTSNETKQKINANINTYSEYWDKSYKYIKELNPDATLVATQFYNPYYEISLLNYDLSGFVDEPINQLNRILKEKSNSEKNYKIAKIYDDFNTTNPRLTNVNISLKEKIFIFDPHPNEAGHQKIATRILDVLTSISEKKDISKLTISEIKDMNYTGNLLTPSVVIKDGSKTLVEDTDYSLIYINNKNVGQAQVSITGIGDYSGKVIKTFNIKESNSKQDISKLNISNIDDQTYTGFAITPLVEIKNNGELLYKDKDYLLTYKNNVNAGNATVVITGIGNYTGNISKQFVINPLEISNTQIAQIENQTYTGQEVKPDILITNGSSKLILDKDYTLEYQNNINTGTATITINGINNYSSETNVSFQIEENTTSDLKNISDINCTEIVDKIYTGKNITPEIVLKDEDYVLIKNKDYTLSYDNNINIGVGTLTIKGIGNYTGEVKKDFNIIKKDINFTLIDDIEDQLYTGKEIKPRLIITSDHIELEEGKDYTVTYSNNINKGTATITIEGINNYTGVASKTYNIVEKDESDKDTYTYNNTSASSANKDNNTISNKILPFAGFSNILIYIIIILFILLVLYYKKFKKNNY